MHTRTLFALVLFVATLGAQGTVTSTAPSGVLVGGASFLMAVNGSGFTSANIVQWDGVNLPTAFASGNQLAATVTASLITSAGSHSIRVKQSALVNNFSNVVTFNVNNPVPTLTSLTPSVTPVGSGPITIDFGGTNFVAGSIARLGGINLATTFISATHIQGTLPASMTAAPATLAEAVFNPTPGGGTATFGSFLVTNPVPTLGSISPTSVTAGIAGLTLTANGTNYNSSTVVRFDGSPLTTTLVSATQVTAQVSVAQVALGGNHTITVINPGPGGGTTTSQAFTVNNPLPVISGVSPGTAIAGVQTTLTITGSGFNAATTVRDNGIAIPTIFTGSASSILAQFTPALSAAGTSHQISVANPAPGGGNSVASFPVSITNPAPVLSTINPTQIAAPGGATQVSADGLNFVSASVIRVDGTAIATNFISGTLLFGLVPAGITAIGGAHTITVFTPAPGGGTSSGQTLTVNNPVPTLASINPATILAGSPSFTLTTTGTGYNASTAIILDGSPLTTTFVSSTQVSATIAAALVSTAVNHTITVSNPGPGGGTSPALTLTVQNPVPSIANLSPATILVGAPSTVTVNGSGFVAVSVVRLGGQPLTTTFVSSSQLTAVFTAIGTGIASIDVSNPAPGGGFSNPTPLAIENPVPVVSSLSPASAVVNATPPSLAVNGSNFVAGSQVLFNGNVLPTVFLSSSLIGAVVPGGAMNPAGVHQVSVVSPGPGGGISNTVPFTVGNPVPVITSLSAFSIPGGGSDALVTMTGTGFTSSTVAAASGTAIGATFQSSTQLNLVFPTSLQRTVRDFTITVTNPGPGGGSASIPFTVDGPTISACTPAVVPVMTGGSPPITLTVVGAPFQPGDVIRINGAALPTTLVNTLTLTCTLDGSFPVLLQPGGFAVTVTRPGSFSFVASNAFGVPVGIAGTPDNAGSVTLAPAPPGPGQGFNLRVELPVTSGPVTLIAQVPAPPTFMLNVAPGFDLVIGPGLNSPIILADGLGLFGPPTPTFAVSYDFSSFAPPADHGVFEILNLAAPPVQLGITFSLAAIYADPASPIGLNATHVSGPQSL